jgi:excisionase family DNA binding protein
VSNDRKHSHPFAGDLLHPYFKADGRLLTVPEVAERLGVCAATVYTLCASGSMQHIRVLNSIRVPAECLRAFIASRHTTPG